MRVSGDKVVDRFAVRIRVDDRLSALGKSAEDSVDQASNTLSVTVREVHALRNDRITGHTVQTQDLIRTGAEEVADGTLLLRNGLFEIGVEVEIETSLPGYRSEDDFPKQTSVRIRVSACFSKEVVCVRSCLDLAEDLDSNPTYTAGLFWEGGHG